MTRRVFFSFHYDGDAWRTNQIRNAGTVTGDQPVKPNAWETVRRETEPAIRRWIDAQIARASCTIVLIGEKTAARPWVQYEIEKSWQQKKALFGIRIHRLLDQDEKRSRPGPNPFSVVYPSDFVQRSSLHGLIHVHDPPYIDSKRVYNSIINNIDEWVEAAVLQRDVWDGMTRK